MQPICVRQWGWRWGPLMRSKVPQCTSPVLAPGALVDVVGVGFPVGLAALVDVAGVGMPFGLAGLVGIGFLVVGTWAGTLLM